MTISLATAACPVLACVEFDSNNKNKWGQRGRLENMLKSKVKGTCRYAAFRS